MRINYKPSIRKFLENVDGLGHILTNLGHLQIDSKHNYKLGKIGQQWQINSRPPVHTDQLPGWTVLPDIPLSEPPTTQELAEAPILILPSYPLLNTFLPLHLEVLRLRQTEGSTSVTRTHDEVNLRYHLQTEGFLACFMANDSNLIGGIGTVSLFGEDEEIPFRHILLKFEQNKIWLNDSLVVGTYNIEELVHLILTWDGINVYCKINGRFRGYTSLENIDHFNGINEFTYATGPSGENEIVIDGIVTSLEGELSSEQYDSLVPGTINSPGVIGTYLRSDQGILKNLYITAEGDYKQATGVLGKQWRVGDTEFEHLIITMGQATVISEYAGHRTPLLMDANTSLQLSITVEKTITFFDLFLTFLDAHNYNPANSLILRLKNGIGDVAGAVKFTEGIIYYQTDDGWIPCDSYVERALSHLSLMFDGNARITIILNMFNRFTIPRLSHDPEITTIQTLELETVGNGAIIDAFGVEDYNYLQFMNYGSGVMHTPCMHSDHLHANQVQSQFINVDSQGNFKLPKGILGKNWHAGIDLTDNGWEISGEGTYAILPQWYGHQHVLYLESQDTTFILRKVLPSSLTNVLHELHIFPFSTTHRIEIGLVQSAAQGYAPIHQIVLDHSGEIRIYSTSGQEQGIGDPVQQVQQFSWSHLSTDWSYDILEVALNRIIQTVPDPTPSQNEPRFFEIKLIGSSTQLIVDSVGFSCFGYTKGSNYDDGMIMAKTILLENGIIDVQGEDLFANTQAEIDAALTDAINHANTVASAAQTNAEDYASDQANLARKKAVVELLENIKTFETYESYPLGDFPCPCGTCGHVGQIQSGSASQLLYLSNFTGHFQIRFPQPVHRSCFQFELTWRKNADLTIVWYGSTEELVKLQFLQSEDRVVYVLDPTTQIHLTKYNGEPTDYCVPTTSVHTYQLFWSISSGWHLKVDSNQYGGYFQLPYFKTPSSDEEGITRMEIFLSSTQNSIDLDNLSLSVSDLVEKFAADAEINAISQAELVASNEASKAEKRAMDALLNGITQFETYDWAEIDASIECDCGCGKFGIIAGTPEEKQLELTTSNTPYIKALPRSTILACYEVKIGQLYNTDVYIRLLEQSTSNQVIVLLIENNHLKIVSENGTSVTPLISNWIVNDDPHELRIIFNCNGTPIPGFHLLIDDSVYGGTQDGYFDLPLNNPINASGIDAIEFMITTSAALITIDEHGLTSAHAVNQLITDAKGYAEEQAQEAEGNANMYTRRKVNLLPMESWVAGEWDDQNPFNIANFGNYGPYNAIIRGETPIGTPGLIWKGGGEETEHWVGNRPAGMYYESIIDPTKSYRFMVFFNITNGECDFELSVETPDGDNLCDLAGNPMEIVEFCKHTGVVGKWYLAIGYIYDKDHDLMEHKGKIIDISTGGIVNYSVQDFKFSQNAKTIKFNCCLFGPNPDPATNEILLWAPTIEETHTNITFDLANAIAQIKANAIESAAAYIPVDTPGIAKTFNFSTETNPTKTDRVNLEGYLFATKTLHPVYNDYADFWTTEDPVIPGKCYAFEHGKCVLMSKSTSFAGICTDTFGSAVGSANGNLPLSVAGFVLAYVDKNYKSGTPLIPSKTGNLTKKRWWQIFKRPVAYFVKEESAHFWGKIDNKIEVNGRSWVKIL